MARRLLRAVLLSACLVVPAAAGGSGVFTATTLSRARKAAETEERIVVVYLYKTGDPDSIFMEQEAWGHPDVGEWMSSHGIATKVDAFSGHGATLRATYRVETLPAILAFRGERLERMHQGSMDGRQLAAWLEVVRIGDVGAADMLVQAAAPSTPDQVDLDDRILTALDADSPAAAAAALIALWNETIGSTQQDERRGRVTEALEPRVAADELARRHVESARDAAWSRYKKRTELSDLLDWFALNSLLGADATTLEWVRDAPRNDATKDQLAEALGHPSDPLVPLLHEARAWGTLGSSIKDPIALIDARERTYRSTKITITGAESSADRLAHHRSFGAIVASLLAVAREKEAREAADHVIGIDKKAGPVLVEIALDANQPRRWQRGLIDPSKGEQVELAMRLTRALEGM